MNEESTAETPALDLDGLINEAQKGANTDWGLIEASLNKLNPGEDYVIWATNIGLLDANQDVRDLAATVLDISSYPLTKEKMEEVRDVMANDKYHIVRYRLAVALCQRGDEHISTVHTMAEAQLDADVGELARAVWRKMNPPAAEVTTNENQNA